MATASELLDRAKNADDLGSLAQQGIGGILLALATGVITGFLSLADIVIKPANAFAESLARLTVAIFGSPARIIIAGAQESARSLSAGFAVGPFTFALGVGSVLLAIYVVGRFRGEDETGNLIPGLPFDIPFLGQEEE